MHNMCYTEPHHIRPHHIHSSLPADLMIKEHLEHLPFDYSIYRIFKMFLFKIKKTGAELS